MSTLAKLRQLQEEVLRGEYPVTGICCEIGIIGGSTRWYIEEAFGHWPKFSGNCQYPVPSGGEDSPVTAYQRCALSNRRGEYLWGDNPYGSNRRDLLTFLIEYFQNQANLC